MPGTRSMASINHHLSTEISRTPTTTASGAKKIPNRQHHRSPLTTVCSSKTHEEDTPISFSRRNAIAGAPLLASAITAAAVVNPLSASAAPAETLEDRINSPSGLLYQPSYQVPWAPKLIFYPRWMFGEWNVSSKFVDVKTPIGKKFVPDGYLQAAEASQTDGGVGSTYEYSLRYYSTLPDTFSNNLNFMLGFGSPEDAIIADKKFNTKQTSNAFLGYSGAVAEVEYDPRDAPLRQTVTLSSLGPDLAPLPPRRLELYSNRLQSEYGEGDGSFRTSELCRQVLVAVRDVQVSDYEVINEFRKVGAGKIVGRQRSLLYLQPQDALYFEAFGGNFGNKAVAVYDYEFTMTRVAVPGDAPRGAVACVETPKDVIQCL